MKLRLPSKLVAAILATASPVMYTTLPTATIGAAAVAVMAGQQAAANVTDATTVVYSVNVNNGASTENPTVYGNGSSTAIRIVQGDGNDGTCLNLGNNVTADYTVLTSTNGTQTNKGRYKVNATVTEEMKNYGTLILAAGSYSDSQDGSVTYNGGQLWVASSADAPTTITNNLVLGSSGYKEDGWEGAIRMDSGNAAITFSGDVTLAQDAQFTVAGVNNTFSGQIIGDDKNLTLNKDGTIAFTGGGSLNQLSVGNASVVFKDKGFSVHRLTVTADRGKVTIADGSILNITQRTSAGDFLSYIAHGAVKGAGTVKIIGGDNTTTSMEVLFGDAPSKAILTHYEIDGSIHFNGRGKSEGAEVLTIGSANGRYASGLKVTGDMRLGNKAHLQVSKNSWLDVDGMLWLGHHDDAGSYPGLLTINGGQASLGYLGIKSSNSANKLTMNGGTLEFTIAGNAIKGASGSGFVDWNPATNSQTVIELNSGTLKAHSASWNLNHKATIGAVTIDTDDDHTIGITGVGNTYQGTITNKGNLSLAGSGSVNIADIGKFEAVSARVADDFSGLGAYAGSGYLQGTATQYYLVKGVEGSSITVDNAFTLTGGSGSKSGSDYTFTFSGDVPQSLSGTYFINSELGYNATEMGDATKLSVSHGSTLTVGGEISSTTTEIANYGTVKLSGGTAAQHGGALVKVTENGRVLVSGNTEINNNKVTQAKGELTVNNGAVLTVGTDQAQNNSLSSFSSITLDNGSIKYQNAQDTVNNVTVASGTTGKIASKDMLAASGGYALHMAGTTRVDGTLTVSNWWNAQFDIEHVSGSGTLKLNAMSGQDNLTDHNDSSEQAIYDISSLDGFTGTLTIDNQKIDANIYTGTPDSHLTALNVTNSRNGENENGVKFHTGANTQINTITVGANGKLTFDGNGKLTTGNVIRNEGKLIVNTDIDAAGISIRSGEVQLNHNGSVGEIKTIETDNYSRSLIVGSEATVEATGFSNGWGMDALQVDGKLSISGELKMATGNKHTAGSTPNKITGEGSISANSLVISNIGTYNIDVQKLDITGNLTANGWQGSSSYTNLTGGNTTVGGDASIDYNAKIKVGGGASSALLQVNGSTTVGSNAVEILNKGTLNLAGAEITKKSGSSDAAVKYVTVDAAGMTGSASTPAGTANISHATITIGTAPEEAAVASLLALADETAYHISDMSFADTDVISYNTLAVSNVVVDGASSVRAADGVTGSTLSGQNYLTLSDDSTVIVPNTNITTDQLSGLTLQSADGNSLSLTLYNTVSDTLTNGAGFSITLSDFKWQDLIGEDGTVQEFAITDQGRLNEVFKVTALGSGAPTSIRVVNAQMINSVNGGHDLLLDVVPEPTTGALSLLALTALAARRRRK